MEQAQQTIAGLEPQTLRESNRLQQRHEEPYRPGLHLVVGPLDVPDSKEPRDSLDDLSGEPTVQPRPHLPPESFSLAHHPLLRRIHDESQRLYNVRSTTHGCDGLCVAPLPALNPFDQSDFLSAVVLPCGDAPTTQAPGHRVRGWRPVNTPTGRTGAQAASDRHTIGSGFKTAGRLGLREPNGDSAT